MVQTATVQSVQSAAVLFVLQKEYEHWNTLILDLPNVQQRLIHTNPLDHVN
jgi:hypothetical protein